MTKSEIGSEFAKSMKSKGFFKPNWPGRSNILLNDREKIFIVYRSAKKQKDEPRWQPIEAEDLIEQLKQRSSWCRVLVLLEDRHTSGYALLINDATLKKFNKLRKNNINIHNRKSDWENLSVAEGSRTEFYNHNTLLSFIAQRRTKKSTKGTDANEKVDSSNRKRVQSAIWSRRGQGKFREDILTEFNRRCLLTGENCEDVLEACHIIPVAKEGEDKTSNGLLLRSDIHTLFDELRMSINPDDGIVVFSSDALPKGSQYRRLNGKKVDTGILAKRKQALQKHWQAFNGQTV